RIEARNRPSRRVDVFRIVWLVPITTSCALILFVVWRFNWQPYPWAVEHCVKVIAICAFIQFGSNLGASAWRVAGVAAEDFSGWFFAASTPAEFWRRWNKPAGRFMHEYIFLPAGGTRRLWPAVMATFTLNGLVHEYVFDIAAGRVLGWALAFFFIQGLATAATLRFRPKGWAKVAGVVLTLIFNLATSVLFFACVNAVVQFYALRRN
ncbi:MAG TPA: MBOAT family O-acyltransferase, partial [Tepidisphaeraceae bacterium]